MEAKKDGDPSDGKLPGGPSSVARVCSTVLNRPIKPIAVTMNSDNQ